MKKVIALMLALVMLIGSSAFVVSAQENSPSLYAIMNNLRNLCEEAHFAYGIGSSIVYPIEPGSQSKSKYLACSDTTEVKKAWEEASAMVEGYFNGHISPYEGEINEQTATEKYNTLYEELYKITIDRIELEKLVSLCEKECNDDGYYDVQLWNDFQKEIAQSKEVLADESITDTRVNSAFYGLMYKLNLICTYNAVSYDVNNDGKMTITDATYIQRYLVGLEKMNFSQLTVVGRNKLSDIKITIATFMQRCLAEFSSIENVTTAESLIYNLEKSNPQSSEFELSSFMYNRIYYYSEQ